MKDRVTIKDVAERAGVSKTTLSRYLNGEFNRMSVDTKYRIRDVIKEMDYKPNPQARGLKNNQSFLIGLVVADILNYYSSVLIKGLQNALSNTDYQLLIMTADNSAEEEQKVIEKLLLQNVDGIILQPTTAKIANYQSIRGSWWRTECLYHQRRNRCVRRFVKARFASCCRVGVGCMPKRVFFAR